METGRVALAVISSPDSSRFGKSASTWKSSFGEFIIGRQRRGQRRFVVLLILAFSLFSIGCGSSIDKAVEQTTEETHPIDPAGILIIRNPLGSIRIYGSDDSEIKLRAIKKAWSASQLNGIGVKISGPTASVSVETTFPPQKTWLFSSRSGAVDYTISVPRLVRIARLEIGNGDVLIENMRGNMQANLVNGALTARNCFGNAELSVANGRLDLSYEKWEEKEFSVNARIISGNVRAFLPGNASFHLLAETVHGNITDHLLETSERNPRRATRVNMSMGTGISGEITIRSTDGNIEIAPAKDAPGH
jgi:hypothetical protein